MMKEDTSGSLGEKIQIGLPVRPGEMQTNQDSHLNRPSGRRLMKESPLRSTRGKTGLRCAMHQHWTAW